MALKRQTPSSAQLTGGDLSVDILHTEDSVQIGDGTNLLGSFPLVGGLRSLPVANSTFATDAVLTGGTAMVRLTDAAANVGEFDDVGGEKALKVSVIASVGGGGGGTAATDEAAFTAGATQGTPLMGQYDADGSSDLTDGKLGIARLSAERALHVIEQSPLTGFATSANQTTIIGHLDGVEGLLTTIDADTGSIDTKLTTTNTHLGTLAGAVSGTEMQVDVLTSALPSGASTSANQTTIIGHLDGVEGLLTTIDADTGAIMTAIQIMDDWDATAGAAHGADGPMMMGSDGTNARRLKTDTSGELQIDVLTIAAGDNNIGNVDIVTLPSIPAGTNNIGDVDILSIAAGDNNIGNVDIVTMPNVTGAAAHDAAISGNPVPMAARAKNTNPTAVADGDSTYVNSDLAGRLVVTTSDRALVTQATGSQATTTEATMLAAGAAGVFHDLTALILTNSNTTTAAQVQIRDATAGTIRFEHVIPANSGMVITFPTPLVQTTAANNWTIDLNAAVSTVYYTVQAIKRIA